MEDKDRNKQYASTYVENQKAKGLVRSNVWVHKTNLEMHKRAAKKLETPNYKKGK